MLLFGSALAILVLAFPTRAHAEEPTFSRGDIAQYKFDADLTYCRIAADQARDAVEARTEFRDEGSEGGIIGSGLGGMFGGKVAFRKEFNRCMRRKGYLKSDRYLKRRQM